MIVYVLNKSANDISAVVRQSGSTVWSSIHDAPQAALEGLALNVLERVDAIILEIAHPADELLYILAQAIIMHKPTLCLYPKDAIPGEILLHLSKKTIPHSILKKAYIPSSLTEIIKRFLATIDQSLDIADVPNIKFTLRLTPSLAEYLDWLVQDQAVNKADYLRVVLKSQLEQDQSYQRYLQARL